MAHQSPNGGVLWCAAHERDDAAWTCQAGALHVLDDTPENLLARVATGDQRAFDALYDQMAALIYGVVLRVLRDPAQSEEVTQEVFIEIWRHAGRFDSDRASARTWALTIAHRRGVDRVRSEQASRDRTERIAREASPEPVPGPADAMSRQIDQGRAADALSTLSAPQREVIELAYYDGLTHNEIANRLRIPLGTVKTRVRDGLTRLRRRVGFER